MKWKLTYNYLLVRGNGLEGFLNDPAAVHLQGQRQDVPADASGQSQLLVCTSKLHGTTTTHKKYTLKKMPPRSEVRPRLTNNPDLKELLDDIIPKHVSHQLVRCLQDFSKHHLPLRRSRPFQLLLDKPAQSGEEKNKNWTDAPLLSNHPNPWR